MTLLTVLLAISGSGIITFLLFILALVAIFYVADYLLKWAGWGDPANKFIKTILALILFALFVNAVLSLFGQGWNWHINN